MAFICTTSQGKFSVEGFENGRKARYIVTIGYDDVIPATYTATIGIEPAPGGLELFFCVSAVNTDTDDDETFWSGLDTTFIRSPADRALILGSICVALADMLSAVQPPYLDWTTRDEAIPDRALIKYEAIRQVIEASGMTVTVESLPFGRWHWHAER